MKEFLDEDFLLENDTAQYLFHAHAEKMPVIDYHCHLSPVVIAENPNFRNLTNAWLEGDHYKWRAMRANGIAERYCTGNAPDREKFLKWAETVPRTLRNPLFHWTHLELQRYFGIRETLNPETADRIYETASALLQQDACKPRALLRKMNVEVVCTTDDPADTLTYHQHIRESGYTVRVIPAWRPDKLLATHDPNRFTLYVDQLESASNTAIGTYAQLQAALQIRHDFFHRNGCRLSDHGLENFYAEEYRAHEIEILFGKLRTGKPLSVSDALKFKSALLFDLAVMDHESGWTQQFHVGALRNNNSRMFRQLGPDTGFDSMGDEPVARPMALFLDRLERAGKLARTILYNLNPAHNEVMATMAGNFQDGSIPGKIQWGSAWWFLDQKDGMERQLNTLSNHGLLSVFIGMLTDSRSFLSYPRHEYFRRILCNLIGRDVENGELPNDRTHLGKLVEGICYYNARDYFKFNTFEKGDD